MAQGQTSAVKGSDNDWEQVSGPKSSDSDWEPVSNHEETRQERGARRRQNLSDFGQGAWQGIRSTSRGINRVMTGGLYNPKDPLPTPQNDTQRAGFNVEQAAEYLAPIPGLEEERIGQGVAGAVETGGKALLKRFGKTALKQGAKAGIVGTAQTGSVKEGGKQAVAAGIAAPVLSETGRFASPLLRKSAQRIYERFLIPGGGSAYNKQTASKAATELIRRGQLAATKGQFSTKVSQNIAQYGKAIETAEDEALEKMGYSPIGTYRWDVKAEPFTENVGPTVDVTPSQALTKTTQAVDRPQRGIGKIPSETENIRSGTRFRYTRTENTRKGMLYVGGAINRLFDKQDKHIIQGRLIEGHESAFHARNRVIGQLLDLTTPNGHMRADSAIKLRRGWDDLVNWEKTNRSDMPISTRMAFEDGAHALRHEIAEQVQGMKEANSQFSFWRGIGKVLRDKQNQTVGHRPGGIVRPLVMGMGGLLLGMHGGKEEALGMAMLLGVGDMLVESGAGKTVSSISMDRFGQLINSGEYHKAVHYLSRVGSQLAR